MLVLDEAHCVFDPFAAALGDAMASGHVLRVGTLSKALGSMGGFVAGRRDVIDLLINTARPYIFTTAMPPGVVAAALAELGDYDWFDIEQAGTQVGKTRCRIEPGQFTVFSIMNAVTARGV